jgi:5'-nucleotidase
VSLVASSGEHYATAARVAAELVQRLAHKLVGQPTLLNVNVPDVPYASLRGLEVTRLGKRHKAEPVMKSATPRGETVYWVGAAGAAEDAGEGTDFNALARTMVSLTPLQIDLTHYTQLAAIKSWLA